MSEPTQDEPKKNVGGRPLKFDDPVKLQEQIKKYYESCFQKAFDQFGNPIIDKTVEGYHKDKPETWVYVLRQIKPFTVSGLAAFLDTSRQTLVQYEDYEHFPDSIDDATKRELIDTVKRAKENIYAYAEERLFMPGVSTGAIFWLKNNAPDNWKDKHEIGGDQTIIVKSVHYTEDEEANGDGNNPTV